MKKIFLTIVSALLGVFLYAQVGQNFALNATSFPEGASAFGWQKEQHKEKPDRGLTLIGLTVGGSLATNMYDYGVYGGEPPAGFLPLPTAGLTFDFESKGAFSFLMGLYLKGKGDKIDMAEYVSQWSFPQDPGSVIRAEAEGSISTSMYWAELPLAFTFNFGRPARVQFGIGGFAGYGLTGKEKSDFSITYYLEEEWLTEETIAEERDINLVHFFVENETEGTRYINRIDYGLYFLLGLKWSPFALTASASWGLSNQIPFKGSDLFSAPKSEKTIRSFTPSLTLTYFFKH